MTVRVHRRAPDVRLGGEPLGQTLARAVTSITVRQALGAPAAAEIVIADVAAREASAAKLGAALTVRLPGGEPLFDGEITGLDHEIDGALGRVLRLRAYDRLHRLRKRQRQRALRDATLAQLVAEAASEIGARAGEVPDAPARPLLVQHDQSDLDLLREFAGAAGLYIRLHDGVLDVVSLAGDGSRAAKLVFGETLLAARFRESAEPIRRSSTARGWDPATLTSVEAAVGLARQDAEELRDGGLQAFPGLGERTILNRIGASAAEAEALAQADMDHGVARQAVLEATVQGDGALRPGRPVALEGVAPSADGRFVIVSALHRFDEAAGYVTEISTAPPALPRSERPPAVSIGRVVDVTDPQQTGRARVDLATFGAVVSDWMPVVTAGAGAGRGAISLPEVGDRVLLLLPDGDPARGIILGGLVGAGELDGLGSSGRNRDFTLRTAAGQRLTLDGASGLARLETGGGDVLEFGPSGARITARRDLVIEAPGRRMTLRAASVDFEQG